MARLKALGCAVLLLAAGVAEAASRPEQAIFLDRSGSMKPYYSSGLIDRITQPLTRAADAEGGLDPNAFSTEVQPLRTLGDIDALPFGNYTFLDKVIDACERKHDSIAWIVTDNIEDTGEAGNTERFYNKLRGDEVLRVTVFPVLAQPGRPGLVVYALLFSAAADAQYDRMLAGFAANGAGLLRTDPLRMKPVNRDTVIVTSKDLAPLTRRGGPKTYQTGVPIHDTVEVRFRSKFDHIELVDSTLKVIEAAPAFQAESLLVPERRQIQITPDRIRALGPGDETTQVYHLSADLGEVRLKNNPAAWWKAAWGKSAEEAELDLRFQIDVPQQNFRLSPRFLQQYSAGTVEEARSTGKVYAIDHLLSAVNVDNTRIVVETPLFFRVEYPAWPAVLWIALLLVALAILAALIFLGRRLVPTRSRLWSVSAMAAGGYPLEARIEDDRVIVDGDNVARIERNHLLPVPPAKLEKGAAKVPLEPGARIHVTTRRNDMDLLFEEARADNPARPSATSSVNPSAQATARRR